MLTLKRTATRHDRTAGGRTVVVSNRHPDENAGAWWRSAAIYQVYVRSFADADGDGIGDIAGIRAHLAHVRALGADAIWLNPWYVSPQADGGYDVADYRDIDPVFGTLADAEGLITDAHELGIRSSATMMYGHVDNPRHWLGHFRVLAGIQDRTGGFTEFVALPFVHQNAPIYLAGIARPGAAWRENRAVHAMARILLHGRIANIQCSWVKLGDAGTVAMLNGGANDLGGTLMEETISRMAGSEHGSARTVGQLKAIAAQAGRPARQRTTTYATL